MAAAYSHRELVGILSNDDGIVSMYGVRSNHVYYCAIRKGVGEEPCWGLSGRALCGCVKGCDRLVYQFPYLLWKSIHKQNHVSQFLQIPRRKQHLIRVPHVRTVHVLYEELL